MRSTVLKDLLAEHGVTRTHNRPRVSNDNPFSESEFRTMKHRPNYPGTFETLEQARQFMDVYVSWYNQGHKHSGIALFSPNVIHDGSWAHLWRRPERVQQDYYHGAAVACVRHLVRGTFGPRLVRVDLDRFSGVPVSPMLSSEDQWVAGVVEEMREG